MRRLCSPSPARKSSCRQAGQAIVVNITSDESTAGDGRCSLREALNNANAIADTTGGDCVAGTGSDTISFSVSGTISLGSVLPAVQNTLTIDGSGQSVTVDAGAMFGVFNVDLGATFNVNNLTIANGNFAGDTVSAGNGGAIQHLLG